MRLECPCCDVLDKPPPRYDFAYMLALAEVREYGAETLVEKLCKPHRELYAHAASLVRADVEKTAS